MLVIDDIHFAIEGKPIFEGASARVPVGHKVGLVGRNGTGKTTLFKLIEGEYALASGDITLPQRARIGGVAQEVPSSDVSLIDTVLAADQERAALLAELETANDARIAEIHMRLADIDAYSAEARAARILSGLGFDSAAQHRPCSAFSGGWRMRVALAAVLFSAPDVLLLDEPTNYLDFEGTVWLETYLASYPHTVIIISHDRALLNRAVDHILHLYDRKLTLYSGRYDDFATARAAKAEQAEAMAVKQEAKRAHLQSYVDRFRYKADKAKQAQSRLKMLEKMTPISLDREAGVSGFTFPEPQTLNSPIIAIDGATTGYDDTPILKNLSLRIDQDDRIALLGANGQGKSTFAKLLVGELAAQSGTITTARKLEIGYFAQHQLDMLTAERTPLEHLRAALPGQAPGTLRSRLAQGGLGAATADVKVANLSGGQKARLSFILATLNSPQLLILDEPTNHLDIESRDALVAALAEYGGAVLIVSHDPWLVNGVADTIWLVKDGQITPFDGDVEAYRASTLKERSKAPKLPDKPVAAPKAQRPDLRKLEQAVSAAEERLQKIEAMREKIDKLLADPALYNPSSVGRLTELQSKRTEIMDGIARAEALWEEAANALEGATV
ncbi:MAG: ABC-F family ATP-binding cassette domain-containing protein [Pseudomonadota bacterium]